MKRLITTLLSAALVLGLCSGIGFADVWNEVGDAGELPTTAQIPVGNNPFTQINGTISGDADMYCISLPTTSAFVATTCGATSFDTQLWVFDQNGYGLSHNDDDPGGCGLQSTVTGILLPGPGEYLIAISAYDYDAVDAAGNELWADTPYNDETPPDGPGGGNPIAGWSGTSFSDGAYTILLQNTEFCGMTATDESTWSTLKSIYR